MRFHRGPPSGGIAVAVAKYAPPAMYGVTLRTRFEKTGEKPLDRSKTLDAWSHPLELGQRLPTLPVWFHASLPIPLEREASYEETCRTLRIK